MSEDESYPFSKPSPSEHPLDDQAELEEEPTERDRKRKRSPQHPNTPDIQEDNSRPQYSDHQDTDAEYYDPTSLITPLGRELTIDCLLCLSRSDYGSIARLSRNFRDLIRSGELYRLRRQSGITEYWVYFSCNVLEWEAYDPYRGRWITSIPKMPPNFECFVLADKESLAVGTELLVFGIEVGSHIVLRYSILTNGWSAGVGMNSPRCLFGSASIGEKAIVAGGFGAQKTVLNSAELYDSEKQTWTSLPRMNKARKMCSGVFMDNKFYVIGGVTGTNEVLTCGEEYDLETGNWRVIPNMSAGLNVPAGAPPLVAVVKNELYAADYAENEVRKYDKRNNAWITLGKLPPRSASVNGWGLAFRACGERLIVIGGPRASGGGMIELNSWVPNEGGPPEWEMVASRHSGNFVFNCAVMGC